METYRDRGYFQGSKAHNYRNIRHHRSFQVVVNNIKHLGYDISECGLSFCMIGGGAEFLKGQKIPIMIQFDMNGLHMGTHALVVIQSLSIDKKTNHCIYGVSFDTMTDSSIIRKIINST